MFVDLDYVAEFHGMEEDAGRPHFTPICRPFVKSGSTQDQKYPED